MNLVVIKWRRHPPPWLSPRPLRPAETVSWYAAPPARALAPPVLPCAPQHAQLELLFQRYAWHMFKVVVQIAMRLHGFLNNNGADAGRIFCKRLRVWHRHTRASCRSSFDSRGPFPCVFFKLGRLLQLGLVGSCCCLAGRARTCTAAECPARSRTRARSAPPRGKQRKPRRERRTPAGRLAARRRLPAASMPPPPRRAAPNPQPPGSRGSRDCLCDTCPCLPYRRV